MLFFDSFIRPVIRIQNQIQTVTQLQDLLRLLACIKMIINCLNCQDQHGLSFIGPAPVSGFYVLFSKVCHVFLSLIVKIPVYPSA